LPARLDDPVDDPTRVHLAEGSDGRDSVQNVAHGAETDHKETELGLRVQTLIFSQPRLGGSGTDAGEKPGNGLVFVFDFNAQGDGLER